MHTRPRRPAVLFASLAVAIVLGACGPTTSTDAPSVAPSASASPGATEPTPSDPPTAANETTQTDTSWGRIWDALPGGFPVYPGATIADDATPEPVSGAFAIPGGDPSAIATWMQAAMENATYSTEALSGPFEDGSVVLDSVGDGDCRMQTVVTPMGGLTLLTVKYGSACPNP